MLRYVYKSFSDLHGILTIFQGDNFIAPHHILLALLDHDQVVKDALIGEKLRVEELVRVVQTLRAQPVVERNVPIRFPLLTQ